MLGRKAILQKILTALTKAVPDHLQIVGPRFAGKTVILNELARRLCEAGTPYTAVLMWDLGHHTPESDELFMQRFASNLSAALTVKHADYAELLKNPGGRPYDCIAEILEALKAENGKVLAIMDGFDKPLSNSQLTRNLWDQLRELALKPSLRLVTASRRTLRDLIRNPDAQTSDFWNIFDPSPVRVGCFDEKDLAGLLAQIPNIRLTDGAQTELWNASNGFPVMVLEVLNFLCDGERTGEINPEQMRSVCEDAFPSLRDKMDSLWRDCSPRCQDLLLRILEDGSLLRAGPASVDADTLIERGFVRQVGNKLQRVNRLLCKLLEELPNENSSLVRLFGSTESYQKHFKGVLERRLTQIGGMDPALRRYLERGLEDLPDHPRVFLGNIHGILEQALMLIWKAECWDSTRNKPHIPSDWFVLWGRNEERNFEEWKTRFPEGGQRLRLLDLVTGTQKTDRLTHCITKNAYVLANAIQGFRDFGVHPKTTDITVETSYVALHLCIELAAVLAHELTVEKNPT
jgi:hypothetical protein